MSKLYVLQKDFSNKDNYVNYQARKIGIRRRAQAEQNRSGAPSKHTAYVKRVAGKGRQGRENYSG